MKCFTRSPVSCVRYKSACAYNEDSNQSAHTRSLITVVFLRLKPTCSATENIEIRNVASFHNLLSKKRLIKALIGYRIAHMHRLVCACFVRTKQSRVFSHPGPNMPLGLRDAFSSANVGSWPLFMHQII